MGVLHEFDRLLCRWCLLASPNSLVQTDALDLVLLLVLVSLLQPERLSLTVLPFDVVVP